MNLHLNDQGILEIPDGYDDTLGTFLFLEIGLDPYKCLVALFHVAQIVQRRSARQAVGGDSVSVELTPELAIMQDHFAPSRSRSIPFGDFKGAVEKLWVVIHRANSEGRPSRVYRPDLTPAQGDLVLWEETFGQRHPYRGQIEGIPASDPD
jgi:hypothetical protein